VIDLAPGLSSQLFTSDISDRGFFPPFQTPLCLEGGQAVFLGGLFLALFPDHLFAAGSWAWSLLSSLPTLVWAVGPYPPFRLFIKAAPLSLRAAALLFPVFFIPPRPSKRFLLFPPPSLIAGASSAPSSETRLFLLYDIDRGTSFA